MLHALESDHILLGRGNICEIQSRDISVSRMHAQIYFEYENNRWLIEDMNSKFGTLKIINETTVEVENE